MAFVRADLKLIEGSDTSHPQMWSYKTADTAATVDSEDYFNDASDVLKVGDQIFCLTGVGGTVVSGTAVVNANASGVVDVADLQVLSSATDTD
jgi:hypothetical protein